MNNIYKRIFGVALSVLMLSASAYAQDFTISVNEPYESYIDRDGERIAKQLKIDGHLSHGTTEKVTAFMYDENGNLVDVAEADSDENGDYTLVFTLRDNISEGEYTFKISSVNCVNTESKEVQLTSLGDEALIKSFSINGKAAEISDNTIKVTMNTWTDLRGVIPEFTLSQGAVAYINNEKQISGTSEVNFSSAVTYKIVSEDLKTEKIYTVTAKNPSNTASGSTSGGGGGGNVNQARPVRNILNANTSSNTGNQSFNDLSDYAWAEGYIAKLSSKGIVDGFGDGSFRPGENVTREQFVKMIVSAFNITGSGDVNFTDVNENHWAYSDIKAAVENGIINGISNDKFGIGSTITRQDMAVMAYRVLKSKGLLKEIEVSENSFADSDAISDYAKEAVNYMYSVGILNGVGDNLFEPQGVTTRAAAAVVIGRMME